MGRSQVAEVFADYRSKRVWMPFYYDGKCADHLHSLGFEKVVHQQDCHCHSDRPTSCAEPQVSESSAVCKCTGRLLHSRAR